MQRDRSFGDWWKACRDKFGIILAYHRVPRRISISANEYNTPRACVRGSPKIIILQAILSDGNVGESSKTRIFSVTTSWFFFGVFLRVMRWRQVAFLREAHEFRNKRNFLRNIFLAVPPPKRKKDPKGLPCGSPFKLCRQKNVLTLYSLLCNRDSPRLLKNLSGSFFKRTFVFA